MARYPKAEDHNIPPGSNDRNIDARIICIHTMVGTMETSEQRFKGPEGIEAHFGVAKDGRVWQWRDTSRQADSQFKGNDYCISIETEDDFQPETRWTDRQFQSLIDLITWIGEQHDIPFRLVKTTKERGIGFHRQFPDWLIEPKSCPGDKRLAQLKNELIPELKEPHMSAADVEALKAHINQKIGAVPDGGVQASLSNLAHGGPGRNSLDSLATQMKGPLKVDTRAIVAAIKSDPTLIEAISSAVATKVAAHLRGGGGGDT
jgi:N-acetylmuramoyl-L-alanine amidase